MRAFKRQEAKERKSCGTGKARAEDTLKWIDAGDRKPEDSAFKGTKES